MGIAHRYVVTNRTNHVRKTRLVAEMVSLSDRVDPNDLPVVRYLLLCISHASSWRFSIGN